MRAHEQPSHDDLEMSVVILEDDRAVRFAMESFLQNFGIRAVAGSTGSEIVSLISGQGIQPKLIIADFRLGSTTAAEELAAVVPALPVGVKVVVTTADTSSDVRAWADACGWDLLIKPYRPCDLLSAITSSSGMAG